MSRNEVRCPRCNKLIGCVCSGVEVRVDQRKPGDAGSGGLVTKCRCGSLWEVRTTDQRPPRAA